VDPWGDVIAQCSEGTNIATAEISLDYIKNVRQSMPVWKHRRNDLYRVLMPKITLGDEQVYTVGHAVMDSNNIIYKTMNTVAFVSRNSIVAGRILFFESNLRMLI